MTLFTLIESGLLDVLWPITHWSHFFNWQIFFTLPGLLITYFASDIYFVSKLTSENTLCYWFPNILWPVTKRPGRLKNFVGWEIFRLPGFEFSENFLKTSSTVRVSHITLFLLFITSSTHLAPQLVEYIFFETYFFPSQSLSIKLNHFLPPSLFWQLWVYKPITREMLCG